MLQDPTFWFMVAFIIFIALTAKKVGGSIGTALDARAVKIKADLDEAEKIREEAQDMLAQYQRQQRDAAKETDEIVSRARAEANRLSDQGLENLEKALARREQLATDRIAQAEQNAIDDIRRLAAEIAVEATQKLLSEETKGERADKLIDQSIKDIPGKLH